MDWEVAITVVHTIKNIVDPIKLNQAMIEKWTLSQAIEDLLELYLSKPKGTVPEVVQNILRRFILHTVKTIRRSIILSNTWKTYV